MFSCRFLSQNEKIENAVFVSFLLEFRKTKRKPALFLILAVVLINAVYLFAGMTRSGAQSLAQPWESLMFYLSLMNTLFLSMLMAVLASRSIDIEHRGNTWNLLQTVQSRRSVYLGKSMYGLFCVTLFEVIQWTVVIILGKCYGFAGMPPFAGAVCSAAAEILAGMVIYQLQTVLSLVFPSQFAALSVNLCGTLTGFFLMYVSDRALTPWSLIPALRVLDMDYREGDAAASYTPHSAPAASWLIACAFLAAALLGGLYLYSRMEEGELCFFRAKTGKSSSLHTALPAELIKLKRSPVWIAFLVMPVISALIGVFNFSVNQGVLSFTWGELWTQQSLFLGLFFLSPLVGIFCSLLWRMEHTGANWNLVLTAQSPWKLVRDKLLAAWGICAGCMLWTGLLYFLSGKAVGLTGAVPQVFYECILCGTLGLIAVASVQSFLSLVIRSFSLPVGIALAGSLAGLMCVVKGWVYALPYAMLQTGLGSTSMERKITAAGFIAAAVVYSGVFYLLSVYYIKLTDVKTHG